MPGTCRNLPVGEARATERVWPKERDHQGPAPPARCPWSSQAWPGRPAHGPGSSSRHRPTLPHVHRAHGHPTDSRGGARARAGSSPPAPARAAAQAPSSGHAAPHRHRRGGPGKKLTSPRPDGPPGATGSLQAAPTTVPSTAQQRLPREFLERSACLAAAATERVRPRSGCGGAGPRGRGRARAVPPRQGKK